MTGHGIGWIIGGSRIRGGSMVDRFRPVCEWRGRYFARGPGTQQVEKAPFRQMVRGQKLGG